MYLAAVLVAVSVATLSYSPSGKGSTSRAGLAAFLMLACCLIFGLTDIFIKRALAYVDSYGFLVYYNALVAVCVLPVVPWLRRRGVPATIGRTDLLAVGLAACFLIAATLLFIRSFALAEGIILPNILVSTRGVFIVVLTALVGMHRHTALDIQSKRVFILRLAASALLVFSIWLALREPAESHPTHPEQTAQEHAARSLPLSPWHPGHGRRRGPVSAPVAAQGPTEGNAMRARPGMPKSRLRTPLA